MLDKAVTWFRRVMIAVVLGMGGLGTWLGYRWGLWQLLLLGCLCLVMAGMELLSDLREHPEAGDEPVACPFCGNRHIWVGTVADCDGIEDTDSTYVRSAKEYLAVCDYTEGGCGAAGPCRATPEEAVEDWNRRTR